MNVNGISSATSISNQIVPAHAPVQTARAPEEASASESQVDKSTGQPVALRFPWLSRLTMQLEKASNRPSPYGATQPLGENIDKKI
ncbi:MAG: hypothetical protein JSR59_16470 [Proteobacteria bacterium]|nr:hypothetical protein [Pseudomonadota bacterium]